MSPTPLDLITTGLKLVLHEHGAERARGDATWLQNILADYSPQTPALNRVAALAASEGVPEWLDRAAPGAADAVVTQSVNHLVLTHAISEEAAHNAVCAWAHALGVGPQAARPTSAPSAAVDDRVARKIQKLLDDADDAETSGDYAEAVERYEEVLTLDPGHASAPRLKAFAERRLDKAKPGPPATTSSTKAAKEQAQAPSPDTAPERFSPPSAQKTSDPGRKPSIHAHAPNAHGLDQGAPSTTPGGVVNTPEGPKQPLPPPSHSAPTRRRESLAIRRVRQLCSTFQDRRVWTPWGSGFDAVKLTSALASYGHDELPKRIVLLYDDTFFGGAGDGFIISTRGVYWKNMGEPPQTVFFKDILKVSTQDGSWMAPAKILVNNRAINVSMNDKRGIARHGSEIIRILAGLPEAAAQSDDLGDDGGLVIDLD